MCLIHVINGSCQKAKISSELKNLTEFSCILWNALPMEFYYGSTLSFLRNTKWNFWSLLCLFSWDNTYAMDWSIKINYIGARQYTEDARHCENADSLYHHHHHQFYPNRHANYCPLILLKLEKKKKPFCQNFDFTQFKFSSLFYSDYRNICRINEKI